MKMLGKKDGLGPCTCHKSAYAMTLRMTWWQH